MNAKPARVQPGSLQAWILASRPPTLPAAIVPVLVGSAPAAAVGAFRLLPFVAALLAALLIQIGTNLANDYFDFRKGADTAARLGPLRVTQSGLLAPEAVRAGMIGTFALAALIGIYLVMVGGWPILLIGVLSITAGVLYTAGPFPLAYNALGDLFAFVFFGLVAVCGTAFLHFGGVPLVAILAALPVAALVTNILVVNNLRDIDTDRAARKHTLAVLLGRPATRLQYLLLLIMAYLVPLLMALSGETGPLAALLPLVSLPLARAPLRAVFRAEGRPLNLALKQTAQLHLVFGALFAVGLLFA
ncbi:MAG TPA: 1,4-dihydroxy-2-naphthoate polyprenyltransferase [Roseiflexaceae bacterium]|nr:1,4-dihydroxy-2-naphthoate polyprenyltransferase [Roseiflexaceae bacterium]HMP42885.1 1,4-dihydroxy-2-naphthoate polyprenyltransferase [Roseiflexaceae bacterium]